MKENSLVLKSINQLLENRFFIPSYQRGYRWSETQVVQLLDDVWEFSQKVKSSGEFYCLQPIVVKAHKNEQWEVIDGQQRLTTIRIILSYLVAEHLKRPLEEAFNKKEFSIDYETRPTSEQFLKNIRQDHSNIDFYYIWSAYEKIVEWFINKDYNDRNKFISALLAKDDKENPVKVIWYEITEQADSIDIFTRLNIGKIPLTNAELIKALFLGKANPENQNQKANYKQLQIAAEWDTIENTLQDDTFWYFIYDENNKHLPHNDYDTRIEYIFDLMKNKKGGEEKYYTFYKFLQEDFENNSKPYSSTDLEAIWLEIKKYFLTFLEWYQDRELYHWIGFLITCGCSLKDLKEKASSNTMTKTLFKEFLRKEIAKIINVNIEDINYGNNKLKSILLIFNIQTLLSNRISKSRFPFDCYKKENWDIEHVRSQNEVELKNNDRIEWAKLVLEFYTGLPVTDDNLEEQKCSIKDIPDTNEKKIVKGLIKLIQKETNEEEFNDLYLHISKIFKEENPPSSDNIANLVLLDAGTNRSYKNAFFPIKRMEIMKREMSGSFVPICTRNVFMKAYSRRFDKIMYWDKSDADDYLEAIKSILSFFKNGEIYD